MAVVLLALGSRGDVQPMAALAGEVVLRGVAATVVATRDFAGLVAEQGAGFAAIPVDSAAAVESTGTRVGSLLVGTRAGQAVLLARWVRALAEPAADTALATVRPGDAVLGGILGRDLAISIAEARGGPALTVLFTGQLPTLHRESYFAPEHFRRSEAYNRWGTRFGWRLATALGRAPARIARDRLGLPQRRAAAAVRDCDRHPTMVAASPLIVPPAPDWPPGTHQTGYPVAPPTPYDPPPDLADFSPPARRPSTSASARWAPAGASPVPNSSPRPPGSPGSASSRPHWASPAGSPPVSSRSAPPNTSGSSPAWPASSTTAAPARRMPLSAPASPRSPCRSASTSPITPNAFTLSA